MQEWFKKNISEPIKNFYNNIFNSKGKETEGVPTVDSSIEENSEYIDHHANNDIL
ncbi:MAG: hypothetical protein QWI36_02190 [Wolbachia endosymbiont of Tyrophagus putrescentiae]|nr:hypothetical protein [Wolbachia endosymbiont of Tyrophagus putrescentiae]